MIHEDTMIMMADGSVKKISEIRIGDYVMTEMGYIKVSNIYSGQENSLVKIISASGLNITLTTEHIIKLADGWRRVSEAEIGNKLCIFGNSNGDRIGDIQSVAGDAKVYNLEFQETCDGIYANNYIVGDIKRERNRFESGLDGEKTNFDLYMEKIKTDTDEILSELKAKINGDS